MRARRRRRISSSLFPENMGPQTTSIQPMWPVTSSIEADRIALARAPDGRHRLIAGGRLQGVIHNQVFDGDFAGLEFQSEQLNSSEDGGESRFVCGRIPGSR